MTAHAEPVSNADLYDILCHLEGAATTCADPTAGALSPIQDVLDAWALAEPFLLDADCDPDLRAIVRRTIDRHPGLFAAAEEYRNLTEAGWPLFDDATAVRAFFTERTGANPFAAPF